MASFASSLARYERWLAAQLGDELVREDLDEKHRKMRKDGFTFLRATCWRWAETILDICPDLAAAPAVLAIGDTHLENFGTWRDAEGRMIWGANDFDEAAVMPYPLDLVRLAASAILAADDSIGAADICDAILRGYARGIEDPGPIVLERDHRWLREAVLLPEEDRTKFWSKLDTPAQDIPPRFADALMAALPRPIADMRFFPRSAGTGSLGRPRFVAVAEWQGGPIVREVKAVLPPVWSLRPDAGDPHIRAQDIATGVHRAPDPHYRVTSGLVVRRLSPNSRKIEVKDAAAELLAPDMLRVMGHEIGNCHAGNPARMAAVRDHLAQHDAAWLKKAARRAAHAISEEQSAYEAAT